MATRRSSYTGNDDIDAVDWRRRVGGIVWRAPSGILVSVLAIFGVSFCLRPGYMATLMSADGALTLRSGSWLPPGDIVLAAGVVGGGGLRAPEVEALRLARP